MILTMTSMLSGKVNTMEIKSLSASDYDNWKTSGALIQNALPHLTSDEREFLLTGSTPEEWDTAFGEQEQDEQYD